MTRKNMVLVDAANHTAVDHWEFAEQGVKLVKRRLVGGVSDGVDILEVDNGRFAMTILLTRGMGIWRGRCDALHLEWASPVQGPVHPSLVRLDSDSGLGWLYGFDEWLVRCGLESNGSPQFNERGGLISPLHGQIANIPASYVEVSFDSDSGEIIIEGTVYESRLFGKKLEMKTRYVTQAGEAGFRMRDTVTNLSASPKEIVMLYHINTGLPFLGKGSRVVVPFETLAPRSDVAAADLPQWDRIDPQPPGLPEVVFFFDPAANADGHTETLLINASDDQGIVLGFNKKQLPCFSLWKSRLPDQDGYVVGFEPATNFPNPTAFESQHGRTVSLASGQSQAFDLSFAFLHNKSEVAYAEQRIRERHATAAGTVFAEPCAEWSE
ncbi:MAG: aldose 1-epimerase family protein [Planctomycetaceae bacterium]|nr:aldose 1-epimerase family protein [Planctomycetaceae bacterium]